MPRRMLALVALAEVLGMTIWFSATAATGPIATEFRLDPAEVAWLTMAVQAGFVAGTLGSALLSLPDLMNARSLFAIGCTVGAIANAGVAEAGSATTLIACRFVTGAALACVYPPGMKIAAGWSERRRGTALGVLVGALTIGSAFPHLLSAVAADIDWRGLLWLTSGLALTGGVIVRGVVRDGPFVAETAPFNPRAALHVFTRRGARLATLGYLGHMWELYAMWTWIGPFAAASLSAAGSAHAGVQSSVIAFIAVASGAPGCVLAGLWADRYGKARIAGAAMLISALCAASAGVFFGAPIWWLAVLAVVWGFAVVADSAQFSALVSEYSSRDEVGTAITVQTSVGFLLTMLTIRLVPEAVGLLGWPWVFLLLVPGPLAGAWAMRALARGATS